jgi:ElaB/YqjD/DUF883 family membrane-anchored ribosome-binding protein
MSAAVVELFDGVDDLIRRVADTESPEIRKVRARVHAALVAAKSAVGVGAEPHHLPAARIVGPTQAAAAPAPSESAEDCADEYPTQTLGLALLLGLGLGLIFRR